ncbi:MAG: GTPase ObgE [Pirellulales bacterium]
MFVDRVTIHAEAGKGGDGCVSFRRERYIPRGGPNGGDGGHGGSVTLLARAGVDSLSALARRKHWKAGSGQRGGSDNCHGRSARDLILEVPPGTVVRDADRDFVLKDLAQAGDQVCVARGGKGGKGNTRFKSSTNRTPRESTPGTEGERRIVELELKMIADVGLAGKPNAGKSTLLSRISRARPRIADYPFTTKSPNLGLVRSGMDRSFVVADIPGLIEGAHEGAGMGHEFLRHIERTRVLVHLVEPQPTDGSDPLENYRAIRSELKQYHQTLVDRPEIVVVSKADLPEAAHVREALAEESGRDVLAISAATGEGHDLLLRQVHRVLDQTSAEAV